MGARNILRLFNSAVEDEQGFALQPGTDNSDEVTLNATKGEIATATVLTTADGNATEFELINSKIKPDSVVAVSMRYADTINLDTGAGAATNATPIVITTASAHGAKTGDRAVVRGVEGNTNANGAFTITVLSTTTFSLDGSSGDGARTGTAGAVELKNNSGEGTGAPSVSVVRQREGRCTISVANHGDALDSPATINFVVLGGETP